MRPARAIRIGAGNDDRGADSPEGAAKFHRGRNLATRRIEKDDGVEISLADVFLHEFKKLGRGLIADLAFGLDDNGAAPTALRRIANRNEGKRHIVGVRCRQRHHQPEKSENARAKPTERFQSPGINEEAFASTFRHDPPPRPCPIRTTLPEPHRIMFRAANAIDGCTQN